jgi:polysaccharide biosynthesis PFTS motif protein
VNEVSEGLTVEHCIIDGHYSKFIFGIAAKQGELVVRQFLLAKLAGIHLGKAILYAHGKAKSKVVFPFPPKWRSVLHSHGFEVATLRSMILWNALVFRFWLYGCFSIARTLIRSSKAVANRSFLGLGRYVFFDELSAKNLPLSSEGGISYDIVSWYQQWPDRTVQLDSICHTVQSATPCTAQGAIMQSIRSAIPQPTSIVALLRYLTWGIAAISLTAVDLLRGRWWHALMLAEASKAALARIVHEDQLARDYLFHNSGAIYRPLWTYEAEAKGSRIIIYFYSTNCESFKHTDRDPLRTYYGYQAMAWPHYLVWDQYQATFIRRVDRRNPRIDIVGSIWFSAGVAKMPALPSRTVAVFDVQPVRDAFYNTLAIEFDYYTPTTVNQFLTDIYEILNEYNLILVLKRKREIGNLVHPSYRSTINSLAGLPNYIALDPDISAVRVIRDCKVVISLPFTSTALIGREEGKPSVYYDPNGLLQRDDPAAHGIEILQGQVELRRWLNSIIGNLSVCCC